MKNYNLPRAIEVAFPIVEINRLAEPERNSFKPIYQMHKWFARRASCVFRAILLAALKPAFKEDGTPTNLVEEFYKDHTNDPDTVGKVVLDPFMGGGTTVVEALRLGCKVIGVDLNPVAWFIVKTEVEPVDLKALEAAFERLANCPVPWNGGNPLRETLLDIYKTEVAPGVEADVIYTFWVKHAFCTDPNCKREVPLFKDYIIAQRTVSVRYHQDAACPSCKKFFDWEVQVASLIAEPSMMVNAPRGSAGEGRPTSKWVYAPEPPKPLRKSNTVWADLTCPQCEKQVKQDPVWGKKRARKKVPLTVLLCPACEAVWQWRGPLPEGEISCPACSHLYDPRKGNVPEKGVFQCRCGNKDKIIESIRLLQKDQRLPIRPYALQAYLLPEMPEPDDDEKNQTGLYENTPSSMRETARGVRLPSGLMLPPNGKFFKKFSASDQARLHRAEMLWEKHKDELPYPQSVIPIGEKTKSGLLAHHYNDWHEMFAPRQLLALSTLLQGIMAEKDKKLQEILLCAFSGTLELNNMFTRYMVSRSTVGGQTAQGVFARHDYQPKVTIAENNVFGLPDIAMGSFSSKWGLIIRGMKYQSKCWDFLDDEEGEKRTKIEVDKLSEAEQILLCKNSAQVTHSGASVVVTDPPYVGNVNYAELADFFYVWLRLALKDRYPWFAPEYTPKTDEIVENPTRNKRREDFYLGLSEVFRQIRDHLPENGLLVFTFHHTDQEGTVWEGLLQSLCDTGFEIAAVYPVHGESESSLHLMDKENVSYDLIHVCRKRREDPTSRSWAGIRQEIRRNARAELAAIEAGRYGNKPLPEPDVRLICIGKCLELYSAHYGHVMDHEGKPLPLHRALQDIGTIVDQLVTRERPLPPELEGVDAITYVWLRMLLPVRREVDVDKINKGLRAMQITVEDLKRAGLIIRGRTGRGRTYEVKQPKERLEQAIDHLNAGLKRSTQETLFQEEDFTQKDEIPLVDLLHALIALSDAGESVVSWIDRFRSRRPEILAGLRFVREARPDWADPIDRIIGVMEGAPLLRQGGVL